jgi:competence ComEA-like helix-hairpin-helix protein
LPTRSGWMLVTAACALGLSIVATAGARQDGGAAAKVKSPQAEGARLEDLGEDEFARIGEEMTGRLCIACHGWADIFVKRRTAREWEHVVRDMAGRGVVGTEAEMALVRRYLTWSFGLVAVNAAAPDELSAVLGLSMEDAEALVAYRKAHGRFADPAELSKVPGIDTAALEAQIDALRFD